MSYLVASLPPTQCGETRGGTLVNIINTACRLPFSRHSREASSNLICSPSTSLVPILISVRDLLSNPISICATILPFPDCPIVDSGNYLYIGIPGSRRLPQRAPRIQGTYRVSISLPASPKQSSLITRYHHTPDAIPQYFILAPRVTRGVVTSIRRACPTPRRAPSAPTSPFRQGPVRPPVALAISTVISHDGPSRPHPADRRIQKEPSRSTSYRQRQTAHVPAANGVLPVLQHVQLRHLNASVVVPSVRPIVSHVDIAQAHVHLQPQDDRLQPHGRRQPRRGPGEDEGRVARPAPRLQPEDVRRGPAAQGDGVRPRVAGRGIPGAKGAVLEQRYVPASASASASAPPGPNNPQQTGSTCA